MEVYEVKVEFYHESESSLGLYKDLKDALFKAESYRTDMIKKQKLADYYEEVYDEWHLMEWVAVGKYANHGITIDERNVL